MTNATSVNNSLTSRIPAEIRQRPASALACATFLGVGLWMGHLGLEKNLPDVLSGPATALFAAVALLQWVAIGRWRKLKTAGAHDHANRLVVQIACFALIEVFLYSLGVISAATAGGMQMAMWSWSYNLSIVAAAIFTGANIWVKHNSVDEPERDVSRYPTRTRSADDILQEKYDGGPATAAAEVFDLTKAIRQREAGDADGLDFLNDKAGTKDRIRTRRRRAAGKLPRIRKAG